MEIIFGLNKFSLKENVDLLSTKKEITLEALIYILIVIIGFLLRIVHLGDVPLSEYEAVIALDGLSLNSNNSTQVISDQTFLTNVLGSLFFLFGTENFLSRLFPALIGTFLIILPAFFRNYFDRKGLLVLSGWIAISPSLVSLSRQIDSTVLLISTFGLFVYFLLQKSAKGSAFFLALALLSGKIFFWNLVLVFLVIVYVNLFASKNEISPVATLSSKLKLINIKTFLFTFLISYTFLSTFGFIYTNQFTGVARGFLGFLNIFSGSHQIGSLGVLTRSILFYEIAVIIVGFIGLVWIFLRKQIAGLTITGFVIINIIFMILVSEKLIIWNIFILGPLMVSGAFFLSNYLLIPKPELGKVLYSTGIALSIFIFIGLALISMFTNQSQQIDQSNLRLLYIAAGFTLIIGAGLLAGWAISWRITGRSFLLLTLLLLLIFTTSATWNAAGLRKPVENELIRLDQTPIGNELLLDIIQDFSSWNYGVDNKASILILDDPSPSLKWSLRSFDNVSFQKTIPRDTVFDVIVTGENVLLEQTDSFRGQKMLWMAEPQWQNMKISDLANWILTRRVKEDLMNKNFLIIWIRNSLVPGMENNS